MKKFCILLALSLALICGTSCKKRSRMETYKFKVEGLQDSLLSDTIWKMIFQVQGIDKLIISKSDSTVVFTANDSLVDGKQLKAEIEKRGGKILSD